ncbi:phospholipase D/nuclease [Glonium stellatum]|uniref:Phospholipase D/nuclease n=1 Tax=Glonium stellatum TaxID=574774 RepID=A0A8E2F8Z0_9PEZI|nr:phospholipase D/nuclease [Glonium stellatum]
MASSDEEEEIRRAIALSLQPNSEPNSPTAPASAAPASIQRRTGDADISILKTFGAERRVAAQPSEHLVRQQPRIQTGILGLDRKRMEEERLARSNRKRQRSISPPPLRRGQERPMKVLVREVIDLETDSELPPLRNSTLKSYSNDASRNLSENVQGKTTLVQPEKSASLQYPRGVVKKTWAFRCPRENDIKIEEVLQKDKLKVAVLSAFDWDIDWVLSKLNIQTTKMVFVMQAKGREAQDQYCRDAADIPNLRLCFPDMSGQINCMHSKLMLLFHQTRLRIVVPSANLNKHDWGETGIMENSVFLIDLPRRPNDERGSRDDLTFFGKELMHFVEAKGLGKDVQDGLLKFDFSETDHLAFVHTIGGSHFGDNLKRTGLPGLGRAVRALNLESDAELEVDFTASSIGSLNDMFLKNLYLAAKGEEPRRIISLSVPEKLHKNFRIYFPLHQTVVASTGGPQSAGTNCLQASYYNNTKFPKDCMRDYKSTRIGLLSHNKILFARGHRSSKGENQPMHVAWAYVGSANVSESAWGKLLTDKSRKTEKLNCRNWECGVLIGIPPERIDSSKIQESEPLSMDVFKGYVDVPFQFPGEEYGSKRPWFFMERE